jgi:hypothetical protein
MGLNFIGLLFVILAIGAGIKGLFRLWARRDPSFMQELLIVVGYISTPFIAHNLGGGMEVFLIVTWAILFFPFCFFLLAM